MLKRFQLENFAIISQAELNFCPGFNVITGETGAGKSILLGAISLLLGQRSGSDFIPKDADFATLNADFAEDLTIKKIVKYRGSSSFLNQEKIKSQELGEQLKPLLMIYGQQHNYELLRPEEQRARLDRFAGIDLEPLKSAYLQWRDCESAYLEWEKQQNSALQELLQYQLQELQQLNPQEDEFQNLGQKQSELANAQESMQRGAELIDALENIVQQGKSALRSGQALQKSPDCQEALQYVENALIDLQEAQRDLAQKISTWEINPEKLAEIEARMSNFDKLARKHRCRPEALREKMQDLETQLQQYNPENGEFLGQKLQQALQIYQLEAEKITQLRIENAPKLSAAIENNLAELGMAQSRLKIEISASEASPFGNDNVQFLLQSHAEQDFFPINKIASGGELSRISLALEVVSNQDVKTIIFDEIDTGIGGEIAHSIGRLLQKLAQKKQVICVTHLPQVAVYAQQHIAVSKRADGQQSNLKVLNFSERIQEIARMLGNQADESSLNWAETMLKQAQSLSTGEFYE